MTGKFFLDTNFLVYCFSKDEPDKRQHCLAFLAQVQGNAAVVLSTQILNEFTAVMIGKYKQPPLDVKAIVADLSLFEVVDVNTDRILEAIDLHVLHKLSFGDSLIISAAKSAHCHTVVTEDLQHGSVIAGVHVVSPFR